MRSLVAAMMCRPAVSMLASVLVVTVAHAGPDDNERVAREHYEHGKQLAADNQFAAAYGEFSAGYDASPRPQFLFNMAECQRALGNAVRAREFYERFVAASPNDPLAPTARARLAELPPTPHAEPQPAPPVTKPASLTPATSASTVAPASASSSHSLIPIAVGAGALALGGGALGFDLWANSTYDQSKAATGAQQTSLWHSANYERYAAEGFAVAGVACAGAAIWLYLRGDREAGAHLQVVPTAGGVTLLGSY